MGAIEFERLTKLYPGGRGVRDLDLSVEQGEVFGFIGPNGAGKSTTIRTLLGLLRPTSGRARILGADVLESGPELRTRVGYVPSEPSLYDGITVGDFLAYAASFHAPPTETRRKQLCDALGLDVSRRAEDLSLGNKKKVMLVAALQHAPQVLILDEPTSGLDPLVQARLFEVLMQEKARGTTVFFSSHVLAEVERHCSRVGILRDGRLVQTASVKDLRSRQTRRVRVRFSDDGSQRSCLQLPGVDAVEQQDRVTVFLYSGEPRPLLAALAADPVVDVTIEELSLEEIFMRHYGDNGGSDVTHA